MPSTVHGDCSIHIQQPAFHLPGRIQLQVFRLPSDTWSGCLIQFQQLPTGWSVFLSGIYSVRNRLSHLLTAAHYRHALIFYESDFVSTVFTYIKLHFNFLLVNAFIFFYFCLNQIEFVYCLPFWYNLIIPLLSTMSTTFLKKFFVYKNLAISTFPDTSIILFL